jgi:LCP family protein required for cell wall assembly
MTNFKSTPNPKRPVSNVDGFISHTDNFEKSDIRKRFRQNYRPANSTFDVDTIPRKSDVFAEKPYNTTEDLSKPTGSAYISKSSKFDLALDGDKKKDKSRRFKLFKRGKKPKRSLGKRIARTTGAVFLILLLSLGSILGYATLKGRQIFRGNGEGAAALQKNITPASLNGEGDGRVNILMLGKGGPGHEAPDLTDTILLASIDPIQNEAALLSVPRDMYVEDANGNEMKINAIYSSAKQKKLSQVGDSDADKQSAEDVGLKAIKDTVSDILGVPVHYYVMVDFTAFKESIDTVGGITIDVKEPLYDASMAWLNGGSSLLADEGLQTFNGTRALMYARSRYGSSRGDFDRTERQREVILALQQKVLAVGTFSNPVKVVELLNTLGNNVRTDLNGTSELKRLYEIAQNIPGDKFVSVGLADPPNVLVATDNIGGLSVVVPTEGLFQYDNIQSYVRNTLRDAFLKKENARVAILNGTGVAGLATGREKELKSYGYNIVLIDNAPTDDYQQTQLIDLSAGKNPYTSSYLEKRLGVKLSTQIIEGLPTNETVDFVIILGSNEANKTSSN